MCRWMDRVRRCRRGDDPGFAMLTVILLMVLVTGLATVAVAAAVRNVHGSGLSRAKVQAVDAAEAGVDDVYAELQNSIGTSVPCGGDIKGTLSSGSTYVVNIDYYSTYPPAAGDTPIACSSGTGLASAPAAALITAVATPTQAYQGAGNLGTRKVQSLVRLSPLPSSSNGFDQALFSDASVTTTNSVTINGDGGLNGNLYTNGDFECNSNSTFAGSVVTQGSAYVTNSCSVQGDLWAAGNVKADSNPTIAGMLKSSTGNATLQSSVGIGKGITVAGTCCSSALGKTTDGKTATSYWNPVSYGVTGMAAPPHIEMPRVQFVPSDWAGEGFTEVSWKDVITPALKNSSHSACTDLGNWSVKNGVVNVLPPSKTVEPLLIDALDDCSGTGISMQSLTLKLYADAAIFAPSFEFQNSLTFTSGDGAVHNLWLIVPWSNGSETCESSGVDKTVGGSSPKISFNINSGLYFNNIHTLVYTPGGIDGSNQVNMTGKVYACDFGGSSGDLRNSFNLTFDKDLGVPGVKSTVPTTYNVDVVYKREVG